MVGISIQRHARRCRSGIGDGETRLLVEGGVEKHKGVWLWWGSHRTTACRGHRVEAAGADEGKRRVGVRCGDRETRGARVVRT